MPTDNTPDPVRATAERRALAVAEGRELSRALHAVGSTQAVTVVERTMTSADGDEWGTGTFCVVADSEVRDVAAAVAALRRLAIGATPEAVVAALHRRRPSRWSRLFELRPRRSSG
jgi:hypothetical protein